MFYMSDPNTWGDVFLNLPLLVKLTFYIQQLTVVWWRHMAAYNLVNID